MKKNNNTAAIIGIAVAVIALVFGGVALTRNIGKSEKTVSKEAAQEKLENLIRLRKTGSVHVSLKLIPTLTTNYAYITKK